MTGHRLLAGLAAILAILAAVAGSPAPARRGQADLAKIAAEIEREEDHVTAIELARWIKDRKQGLRIFDLRGPEPFEAYHIPRAERIGLNELLATRFAPHETVVLISDGGAHAAQAWVLLRASSPAAIYFLRGGLGEWVDDVMSPTGASEEVAALSRYFGGLPRAAGTAKAPDPIAAMKRRGC